MRMLSGASCQGLTFTKAHFHLALSVGENGKANNSLF